MCNKYGVFKEEATSVEEFFRKVQKFHEEARPSSLASIPKEDLQTFYRGHEDVDYCCTPSVFRNKLLFKEAEIYRRAIEALPYEFNYLDSIFSKLCKLQHYGAPTRILDFTICPKIALWFATNSKEGQDGEVIIYRTTSVGQDDLGVKALAFLATYDGEIDKKFYAELRNHLQANYSDEYLRQLLRKGYFVIPKITNERLYRQKGLFLLFGQKKDGEKLPSKLDDNFGRGEEYPGYIGKIRIPNDSKKAIRQELEKEGISEPFLFPDIQKELEKIKGEESKKITKDGENGNSYLQ